LNKKLKKLRKNKLGGPDEEEAEEEVEEGVKGGDKNARSRLQFPDQSYDINIPTLSVTVS